MESRRRKSMIAAALLLLVGVCTVLTGSVFAEEEKTDANPTVLKISPAMRQLDLKPNEKYTGEITVSNPGSSKYSFRVYARPYSIVGDNYEPNFTNESAFTKITEWMKFDKDKYSVDTNKDQKVKYTISVPKDALAGGQYAAIFVETINDGSGEDANLQTVSRLGMVLYANIDGDIRSSGEITEYNLSSFY